MYFDAPQWRSSWVAAHSTQNYAGLLNTVRIRSDTEREVQVNIPTQFFKFAREVLCVTEYSDCFFYLDWCEEGGWLFGFASGGEEKDLHDLWHYTDKQLPLWARRP